LPELGADAVEPRNSGGVSLIDATSKAGRLATCAAGIQLVYTLPSDLVGGGPGWVEDTRYDVEARAAGKASQQERLQMLKTLLAERFQLTFHYESKEISSRQNGASGTYDFELSWRPDDSQFKGRFSGSQAHSDLPDLSRHLA
jgi:hypothetical protein